MNSQEPILSLKNISKVFGKNTTAIANLDLKIYPSEFISLVGPSGCGKSTLLRAIAGLTEVSSGTITWHDLEHKDNLGFVFQEPALMPWSTVYNNVYLPLKLAGKSVTQADAAIQNALELVKLSDVKKSYPRQLSGGMKMRVSIARALVNNPQLLLMDEPFGALDDITRTQLNDELLRLWSQKQWTIVFVTHNIYEAVYLSRRVIVMGARPGRIIADVEIDEPYPRQPSFRSAIAYTQYCQQVSEQLEQAFQNKA
ncbi:ABC transporter ATP-binding protein [Roseofilum casamattae]|uniref:ABC transporter ATP-binding protein n=1 Tax=Roseofilum casamattae BLCC-M143 TaxID=3022442 RepID=A0ABT7BSB9_9CYAN|nr:ABC transporter ATP-binding protein [Roseofilum casamattae]MDJ1181970.1 ABC transporter ATP-binding protein [Roseofilum casamattae BLCC-M143]